MNVQPAIEQGGPVAGGFAGGAAGSVLGGPAGAVVGSAIGKQIGKAATSGGLATAASVLAGPGVGATVGLLGGLFGGKSKATKQHDDRNSVRGGFKQLGLVDQNYQITLPDGSVVNLGDDGQSGTHNWSDPSKVPSNVAHRGPLFAYDTDFTAPLDHVAGMVGTSLSRVLNGGKSTAIDQIGSQLGNGLLGKAGYGAELTPQNFNLVMNNARSVYARAGVQNEADAVALANKMFSEGRVNDTDHAMLLSSADLVFNNNLGAAQALAGGAVQGANTAASTPLPPGINDARDRPGRIFSPVISPQEAMMSVQPYFDWYKANTKLPQVNKTNQTIAGVAEGIGAATAGIGLVKGLYNLGKNAYNAVTGAGDASNPTIGISGGVVNDGMGGNIAENVLTGGSTGSFAQAGADALAQPAAETAVESAGDALTGGSDSGLLATAGDYISSFF